MTEGYWLVSGLHIMMEARVMEGGVDSRSGADGGTNNVPPSGNAFGGYCMQTIGVCSNSAAEICASTSHRWEVGFAAVIDLFYVHDCLHRVIKIVNIDIIYIAIHKVLYPAGTLYSDADLI